MYSDIFCVFFGVVFFITSILLLVSEPLGLLSWFFFSFTFFYIFYIFWAMWFYSTIWFLCSPTRPYERKNVYV